MPLLDLMANDVVQSLDLSDLLRSLLDQQSFGMRDCANTQREGKGVEEEGLDRHGFEEWLFGSAAPSTPSRSQPFW